MRLRLLVIALLAACYAPHPPQGAPCTDSSHCPAGQSCVAGACRAGGIGPDAAPDAASDRDGDGIADAVDDCPDVPDPGQENEDGDRFGDACDPCPVVADDAPADSDGDGVADACDPHPAKSGDHIAVFEGFHHGLPASWSAAAGTVAAAGDDVTLTSPAGSRGLIALPLAAPADATLSMSVTIDKVTATGTQDADVGLGMPYAVATDVGILCWLYQPPSAGAHELALEDHSNKTNIVSERLAWTTATPYVITLTRTGTSYTCQASGGGLSAMPLMAAVSLTPTSSAPVVRGYSTTATVHWVMLVQSP